MWDKLVGTQQIVKSTNEMKVLAQKMAKELEAGDVLLLCGSLGSGKTTFVQSLAKALGVAEQITSPTFTVVAEYEGAIIGRMIHVDLYRLSDKEAINELSVSEVLEEDNRKDAVVLIEWAEKLGDKVPVGAKRIEFEHGESENERKVNFK
jgi:tRNA threonylcarbamoyladenosine biosynthesis protein TsaE